MRDELPLVHGAIRREDERAVGELVRFVPRAQLARRDRALLRVGFVRVEEAWQPAALHSVQAMGTLYDVTYETVDYETVSCGSDEGPRMSPGDTTTL